MVPDKFNPSRFLCGIPQILLPLTFARNLMQLAPSAKGLRMFCSGPCSLPVARICLFGLYRPILCVLFGFRHNSIMACCSMIQVDTIHLWLSLFHAPARLYYVSQRHSHGNKSKHLFVGTLHRLVALCATFIHMDYCRVFQAHTITFS